MIKNFWLATLLCTAVFAAEESATVNRARVNIRGGPSLASEVITQLQRDDKVTVLDEVTVEKPKPGDPAKWAKIKLPANTPVWVFSDFLDGSKVKVKKLNLRAGAGENFSVLGTLAKDDTVKPIRTLEGWTEIEAPEAAHAFVDASYLTRAETKVASTAPEPLKVYEPPAQPTENPVANKPEPVAAEAPKPEPPKEEPKPVKSDPEPKPETVVVKEEPKPVVAEPKPEAPKEEAKPAATPAKPEENTAQPAPASTTATNVTRVLPQVAPAIETAESKIVMTKRTVRREGEVRPVKFSLQAPTYFELRHVGTGKVLNYLTAEKSGLKLKDYKGLRVIITGEEFIEKRFPERPMLEVETIEVAP